MQRTSKKIVLGAKALETSTHPVLFGEDTEPTDICQGKVGDCWLVAAIAAVAEFPHYLEDHVFKTKEPWHDKNWLSGQLDGSSSCLAWDFR